MKILLTNRTWIKEEIKQEVIDELTKEPEEPELTVDNYDYKTDPDTIEVKINEDNLDEYFDVRIVQTSKGTYSIRTHSLMYDKGYVAVGMEDCNFSLRAVGYEMEGVIYHMADDPGNNSYSDSPFNVEVAHGFTSEENAKEFFKNINEYYPRSNKKSRCPYLSGNAIWVGFNDLATTHPELAAQWHPTLNGGLTPKDVSKGKHKKVLWILPYDDPITGEHFDFIWDEYVYVRVQKNIGCPYLSGHRVWKGFNDLAKRQPELAKQWHPTKNGELTTEMVTEGHNKKVWWLYPYDDPKTGIHYDFEWDDTIPHRISGRECPFLSGRRVWVGFNDLAFTHPDLAAQWHPTKNKKLTPYDVSRGYDKKVWWLLSFDDVKTGKHYDFEWKEYIYVRIKEGIGCPYLSGHRVWEGYNDLLSSNPELAKEFDLEKNMKHASEYGKGSADKVWWKCSKCGHTWFGSIVKRAYGRGCSKCSRR